MDFPNIELLTDEINKLTRAYELLQEVYYSTGPYNKPYEDKMGNKMALEPEVMRKLDNFFEFDDSE